MRTCLFLLITFLITLTSCKSNDKSSPPDKPDQEYAFIKDIIVKADSQFIDADYVQFLLKDSAIAAAIKAGREKEDPDAIEESETETNEPHEYLIINQNLKIRRLYISKDCKYELLTKLDRGKDISESSFESLKKINNGYTLFLLTISDGKVVRIEEVYTP